MNYVGRAMPSSSLDSAHGHTTLGMNAIITLRQYTRSNKVKTWHTLRRFRTWHAIMALQNDTRADDVSYGMAS